MTASRARAGRRSFSWWADSERLDVGQAWAAAGFDPLPADHPVVRGLAARWERSPDAIALKMLDFSHVIGRAGGMIATPSEVDKLFARAYFDLAKRNGATINPPKLQAKKVG